MYTHAVTNTYRLVLVPSLPRHGGHSLWDPGDAFNAQEGGILAARSALLYDRGDGLNLRRSFRERRLARQEGRREEERVSRLPLVSHPATFAACLDDGGDRAPFERDLQSGKRVNSED